MNRLPKNQARRRLRLTTLRLAREGAFSPPEGYPETRVAS